MMPRSKFIYLLVLLTAIGLFLAGCSAAATEQPTLVPAPTCPAALPCPTPAAGPDVPNQALWESSAHNNLTDEPFSHWNDTADQMVPATCATCHTPAGYLDFLGADGTPAGTVENPAPVGSTINCAACHNEATEKLTSVTFLSGVTISNLGPEARCMVCHQGRATKTQVDAQIAQFEATDADAVVPPMKDGDKQVPFGFLNIHYYAAAITLYGTEVKGGYEYDGNLYDFKNDHVPGYNTCVGCHDPHTLKVKVDQCAECHEGVTTADDLKNVRMVSSAPDYDGDGNTTEGMYYEIEGLRDALYAGMQAYAKEVTGTNVIYDTTTFPYFFADADNDGKADTTDAGATAFSAWTPRLLKAAFNYQISVKDPGAFAHGNKYIIQLLFDSLADLNARLTDKIDMTAMHRDDAGHFAGNSEPFRHWDAEGGEVPATCARCHTATGLPQFIKEGVNITNHASNGFQCSTCHDTANFPAFQVVNEVTFPSGAKVSFGDGDKNNLCIECHQGRESTVSMNKAVAGADPDTPSDTLRFRNVHYFAAGATLFGTEVKGIYEYPGQTYLGRFNHEGTLNTCTSCHDAHALAPKLDACKGCHLVNDTALIRMSSHDDYDGDGDTSEGLKGEVDTYAEKLYAAIQAYATEIAGVGILYDPAAYPYFFADQDGDGKADVDASGAAVAYTSFTPRLLEAAYNYQYVNKDPGAYVHNGKYVMQALYDSIADLQTQVPSIDMTGMVRP